MIRHLGSLTVLLALLSMSGCGFLKRTQADPAEGPAGPLQVRAEPVRVARFEETVQAIGTCTSLPTHTVLVSPAIEGVVSEILVEEGAIVDAGQPLIRMDDRLARQDLADRNAAKVEFEAGLALLTTLPREPERRAAQLEATRAEVSVVVAKSVLDRLGNLKRIDVSEQILFEAQQKLREAQLAQQAAEARRDVLMLGPKPEAVTELRAKILRADVAIATAEARLSLFTLTSPRKGVVDDVLCHPGQHLAAGTLAIEVLDTSEVFVTTWVTPRDAAKLRVGQGAKIIVDEADADEEDEGDEIFGTVAFVGSQASAHTGTLPARVHVDNADGRLRLGTVVSLEIVVGVVEGALAVPDNAVLQLQEGPMLMVVRHGKAQPLHPRVGWRFHGLTQVSDDALHEGDLVITQGAYNLPEDTPVAVQSDPSGSEESKP